MIALVIENMDKEESFMNTLKRFGLNKIKKLKNVFSVFLNEFLRTFLKKSAQCSNYNVIIWYRLFSKYTVQGVKK
jgi:hypothetical protein